MKTAEMQIEDEDFVSRLTDLRVWLDEHHFEPSGFTYFYRGRGLRVRIVFPMGEAAAAFVRQFGGSLLTGPGAAAIVL